MKKSIKKVNTKSVPYTPIKPVVEVDITDVHSYDDMIATIASAKLDAGYDLTFSESVYYLTYIAGMIGMFAGLMIKADMNFIEDLLDTNKKLSDKLDWATRPWYKKLMFWKKNPNK